MMKLRRPRVPLDKFGLEIDVGRREADPANEEGSGCGLDVRSVRHDRTPSSSRGAKLSEEIYRPFIAPTAWSYTCTQARAASVQLILPTSKLPCCRRVLARGGCLRTATILFAISLMSQKSTFSACCRTSLTPDCLEMMTGTSWLIASSGAMPNGSLTLGITYRSAMRKTFSTSPPRRNPVNSTLC